MHTVGSVKRITSFFILRISIIGQFLYIYGEKRRGDTCITNQIYMKNLDLSSRRLVISDNGSVQQKGGTSLTYCPH